MLTDLRNMLEIYSASRTLMENAHFITVPIVCVWCSRNEWLINIEKPSNAMWLSVRSGIFIQSLEFELWNRHLISFKWLVVCRQLFFDDVTVLLLYSYVCSSSIASFIDYLYSKTFSHSHPAVSCIFYLNSIDLQYVR